MKTMITLLFSALCVATVSAQTDEKDNAMLNNGINFLDIPYVAHTLEPMAKKNLSSIVMK